MAATTDYGTLLNVTGDATVEDMVSAALGDWGSEHDVPAICAEYRAAVNAALPPDVSLCGNQIYGPHPKLNVDLSGAVESVDFWSIVTRHAR